MFATVPVKGACILWSGQLSLRGVDLKSCESMTMWASIRLSWISASLADYHPLDRWCSKVLQCVAGGVTGVCHVACKRRMHLWSGQLLRSLRCFDLKSCQSVTMWASIRLGWSSASVADYHPLDRI